MYSYKMEVALFLIYTACTTITLIYYYGSELNQIQQVFFSWHQEMVNSKVLNSDYQTTVGKNYVWPNG